MAIYYEQRHKVGVMVMSINLEKKWTLSLIENDLEIIAFWV